MCGWTATEALRASPAAGWAKGSAVVVVVAWHPPPLAMSKRGELGGAHLNCQTGRLVARVMQHHTALRASTGLDWKAAVHYT